LPVTNVAAPRYYDGAPLSQFTDQEDPMTNPPATHHDAELILKLYDLRREPVMREARNFISELAPRSVDDLIALANAFGTKENAYVRQVYGYWEMVAALVLHGALNAALVFDTCHEMYFVYAKIQPFLKQFREKTGMADFLVSLEKLVESSSKGRQRVATIQKRQAGRAKVRSQAAQQSA
jgi:hypothetical protein